MTLRPLAILIAAAFWALASNGPASGRTPERVPPAQQDVFLYGVAWYPEWVEEASWDADLALMRRAGITFVRVGEFAWAKMEPREGEFDFAWLDRAIARAQAHGIRVVVGTPTAGPPTWLTTRYPETLLVEADGRSATNGGRRHFSVTSAVYRRFAARIAGEIGKRYGSNPAVVGFQIDNEYGRETHDPSIRAAFHQWLRARYGTIDRLNAAWFNIYWSRTYDDWSQIGIPDAKYADPALRLEWLRFFSQVWRDYQRVQIDALRPHLSPEQKITTNYVTKYDNFDFSLPAQDLDVVGWDWYSERARLDPAEGGLLHDLYRGFLGRNPWILEATPQNVVYTARNWSPPRGTVRAMVWQAVGHGADAYAYWPWMTPPGGNEPLHGSVVDTQRRPRVTFGEIAQAGLEVAKAWPLLRGAIPLADTAILHSYDNRWAIQREPLSADYDPWTLNVDYYRAFSPAVGGIDVLRGVKNLDHYRMVVAPMMTMISDADAAVLTAYVKNGGHLVLGPRAGRRTPLAQVREPGAFDALLGARIDHYETPAAPVALDGTLGKTTARIWAERLADAQPGLETLLSYAPSDSYLSGAPAVVSRAIGKGRITLVGAWLDEAGLRAVAVWAAAEAGAKPAWAKVPEGVEVMARGPVYVVINWSETAQRIVPPPGLTDILRGEAAAAMTIAPRDVVVLSARTGRQ